MKKQIYILIGIMILFSLTFVSAYDSQTHISCGGDKETQITCLGDQELSFFGKIITEQSNPQTAPNIKPPLNEKERIIYQVTGEECNLKSFKGLTQCINNFWYKYWIFIVIIGIIILILIICLIIFLLKRRKKKRFHNSE